MVTFPKDPPLNRQMFNLAMPLMIAYQSDLGHDALILAEAKEGDVFVWGVREMGTELRTPTYGRTPEEEARKLATVVTLKAAFKITVTGKSGLHAFGTVEPLPLEV
jgi:hypothetical protein